MSSSDGDDEVIPIDIQPSADSDGDEGGGGAKDGVSGPPATTTSSPPTSSTGTGNANKKKYVNPEVECIRICTGARDKAFWNVYFCAGRTTWYS